MVFFSPNLGNRFPRVQDHREGWKGLGWGAGRNVFSPQDFTRSKGRHEHSVADLPLEILQAHEESGNIIMSTRAFNTQRMK